jgi:hypothetical protein
MCLSGMPSSLCVREVECERGIEGEREWGGEGREGGREGGRDGRTDGRRKGEGGGGWGCSGKERASRGTVLSRNSTISTTPSRSLPDLPPPQRSKFF